MTSRDGLIEWIKGLLAGPFVLHAAKTNGVSVTDELKINADAKRRYAEIFLDIERLIDDQSKLLLTLGSLLRLSVFLKSTANY
ncbi:unnamed protein product [Kuraishia capsulata CBS 1993]|uniref:Uncharacterized protein n=1 Tax=Kuraishia capsulata CBS 1993 TaxID=1382522 RepID=W6MS55_9ASCO|nr:uncharacterized protein KUCA_T00005221001 [Kuraishia capsulata CBS 1993]CDK29233.1 unnamed protein product [Kuraishia capsulata CBS 1993]